VESQDADPGSLLNLYRRLIHLRKQDEALATGMLVPLTTTDSHVAAYLRRAGTHAVLVVANLGGGAARGVAIGSAEHALPAGSYSPRNLLGGPNGAALKVSGDGRIREYVPVPEIKARESLVLELVGR
jgi:hypothetical protein